MPVISQDKRMDYTTLIYNDDRGREQEQIGRKCMSTKVQSIE